MRALMFGMLVVAMVAVGCSGDDDDAATPTTTASATTVASSATEAATTTTTTSVQEMEAPSTTVPAVEGIEGAFTFADDDLCEWVSAEKVAEFVAAEFDDPDVTAVLDESSGDPAVLDESSGDPEDPDSCEWYFLASTAPHEYGRVVAGNAESSRWAWMWEDDLAANPNDTDFAGLNVSGLVTDVDGVVSGHPSLSDGVVVRNGGWFSMDAFWVPPSDEYLSFSVYFPEVDGRPRYSAEQQPPSFGVADRFVQELGWLG